MILFLKAEYVKDSAIYDGITGSCMEMKLSKTEMEKVRTNNP